MSTFKYKAIHPSGKKETGLIECQNAKEVRNLLVKKNLILLEVEKTDESTSSFFTRKISNENLITFTRQLSSLLDSSLTIEESLSVLIEQVENNHTKKIIRLIKSEISSGSSFSNALRKFPNDFSSIYIGLISAGEESGKLPKILSKLSDYMERRSNLVHKIKLALTYPIIVSIISLIVIIFLLSYVVPQIVSVFSETKQNLPFLTTLMLFFSDFIKNYGLIILFFSVCVFFFFKLLIRIPTFKYIFHEFVLNIPIYKSLDKILNSVRFASTLSISINAGIPIINALTSSRDTISNLKIKKEIDYVIEDVKSGISLSKSMSIYKNFSPLLIYMIRSGEHTGNIADMLNKASISQEQQLERKIMIFASILEPFMILFMGVFVLIIVLSVLMPIIEINQLIS